MAGVMSPKMAMMGDEGRSVAAATLAAAGCALAVSACLLPGARRRLSTRYGLIAKGERSRRCYSDLSTDVDAQPFVGESSGASSSGCGAYSSCSYASSVLEGDSTSLDGASSGVDNAGDSRGSCPSTPPTPSGSASVGTSASAVVPASPTFVAAAAGIGAAGGASYMWTLTPSTPTRSGASPSASVTTPNADGGSFLSAPGGLLRRRATPKLGGPSFCDGEQTPTEGGGSGSNGCDSFPSSQSSGTCGAPREGQRFLEAADPSSVASGVNVQTPVGSSRFLTARSVAVVGVDGGSNDTCQNSLSDFDCGVVRTPSGAGVVGSLLSMRSPRLFTSNSEAGVCVGGRTAGRPNIDRIEGLPFGHNDDGVLSQKAVPKLSDDAVDDGSVIKSPGTRSGSGGAHPITPRGAGVDSVPTPLGRVSGGSVGGLLSRRSSRPITLGEDDGNIAERCESSDGNVCQSKRIGYDGVGVATSHGHVSGDSGGDGGVFSRRSPRPIALGDSDCNSCDRNDCQKSASVSRVEDAPSPFSLVGGGGGSGGLLSRRGARPIALDEADGDMAEGNSGDRNDCRKSSNVGRGEGAPTPLGLEGGGGGSGGLLSRRGARPITLDEADGDRAEGCDSGDRKGCEKSPSVTSSDSAATLLGLARGGGGGGLLSRRGARPITLDEADGSDNNDCLNTLSGNGVETPLGHTSALPSSISSRRGIRPITLGEVDCNTADDSASTGGRVVQCTPSRTLGKSVTPSGGLASGGHQMRCPGPSSSLVTLDESGNNDEIAVGDSPSNRNFCPSTPSCRSGGGATPLGGLSSRRGIPMITVEEADSDGRDDSEQSLAGGRGGTTTPSNCNFEPNGSSSTPLSRTPHGGMLGRRGAPLITLAEINDNELNDSDGVLGDDGVVRGSGGSPESPSACSACSENKTSVSVGFSSRRRAALQALGEGSLAGSCTPSGGGNAGFSTPLARNLPASFMSQGSVSLDAFDADECDDGSTGEPGIGGRSCTPGGSALGVDSEGLTLSSDGVDSASPKGSSVGDCSEALNEYLRKRMQRRRPQTMNQWQSSPPELHIHDEVEDDGIYFNGIRRPRSLNLGTPSSKSSAYDPMLTPGTPDPIRNDLKLISGDVGAIMFDFDGTLTASPGEGAQRSRKQVELQERAPLLAPRLRALREAGIVLGIISKSSQMTILTALRESGLAEFFTGPVVPKAVGLEGKAGFIDELLRKGRLGNLTPEELSRVVLIDDDVRELDRARTRGLQTYASPCMGGLQEDDFDEIFEGVGLLPRPQFGRQSAVHSRRATGVRPSGLNVETTTGLPMSGLPPTPPPGSMSAATPPLPPTPICA
eukprot:TRINITY_DN5433_c0_g3_i1.p1 TRINITY_DN5433_c0_g3~~TRINITY_DN5433_c0_g3_i1.p1  ORF type:complete len:1390 (+),score=226.63 TRINITY_DN5433_c0_g3_i1:181-4170(+)